MHLLIIEDESAHQELIAHALDRATLSHFTWDMKGTLTEARTAVQENAYDLILTDLSLPDSPIEATLKSVLELAGKSPVIVLTSLDDPQTILRMIRDGAKDCIPKQSMGRYILERAIIYCIDRERLQNEILDREIQLNAELLFRRLFDKSRIPCAILTLNGVILKANPALSDWLGYEPEWLINRNILEITHLDHHELSRAQWEKVLTQENDEIRYQKVYIHRDGSPLHGEVILQSIEWQPDALNMLVSIFDLTRHRQTEHILKEARDNAEEALQAKGALLSMMSHDIRAPITSIVGMADYLGHADIPADEKECIEVIKGSGMSTLNLIDDILELSKLESGTLTIQPRQTDIREVVTQAATIFTPQAAAKDINLATRFDILEAHPVLDEGRINQILTNLIGNAVKFTEPHGKIAVKVSQRDGRWLFVVQDSGIGISDEDQLRIFKAFSQANEKIQPKYGGTGLGLSICKSLSEAMGGSISVVSQPGKGSTFTVELPELSLSLKNRSPR